NTESAQGVDRAPRVRVDDDDDAVAVAADPHALSIRTGRDALDELRNRDDALRFALRHVEPADRSIDDVRREQLIPGGGHRQHMRRTPVRRYGANDASIAEIDEYDGAADLRRHSEARVAGEERHPMRAAILAQVDRPRDGESREIDDGDAVTGSLAGSVVAHDGPFTVVRRRDLVRRLAAGEAREHAPRRGVDHRGGVVADVTGD